MIRSAVKSASELCGQSDLSRAVDEFATCTSVELLQGTLFEIRFHAPRVAAAAAPGEFAQLLVDEGQVPLLRRPFSFSRVDISEGTVSFYLAAVGRGSSRLRLLHPGDRIRVLGPLGRGFSLPSSPGRSLLLAGGLGAAPFPLLMDQLIGRGEEVIWLNGSRSSSELYPDHLLPSGIHSRLIRTQDGSKGDPGLVTEGLPELMGVVQRIYACGPNPMLAAVYRSWASEVAAGHTAASLEVSIEAPMGCGFGTCLGCAIPLAAEGDESGPIGLCCRQGPVLPAQQLNWDQLLNQPAHLG